MRRSHAGRSEQYMHTLLCTLMPSSGEVRCPPIRAFYARMTKEHIQHNQTILWHFESAKHNSLCILEYLAYSGINIISLCTTASGNQF